MENKLNEAIFNVIHDIGAIKKDTKGFGYMYATLTSVLEALKKPCKDNNIYFIQHESMDNYQVLNNKYVATVNLTTEIYHKDSNEKREYKSSCMVVDATDPQKVGSVITYLRRYALVSIFAMEQEDDDGANATKREIKKEDKKVNNDSSYNAKKDVYEHKVDYNIVSIGKNKGKQWYELDTESICNALNYYYKKEHTDYVIGIIKNINKTYLKTNNNLCKGDNVIYFQNNQYYTAYISDDIYTDGASIHYFIINNEEIPANKIYNSLSCYVLNTKDRENRLKEKYTKRKIAENKLQDAKDTQNIMVSEDDDPFTNAKDDNWDSSFLMNDDDNTETVENTNNFDSEDGNPFGPDDHINFTGKK